MIFPWLKGFLGWTEAPLTWTLIGINIFFFIVTAGLPDEVSTPSKRDLIWAGRSYAQMQGQDVPRESTELLILGTRAIRDRDFFASLPRLRPSSDEVGTEQWRTRLAEFREQIEKRPVNVFGLRSSESARWTWLTYQFMHAGVWHLVGNLLMLLIFAAALEQLTSSRVLVGVYILGGAVGAVFFLLLSPATTAPMVGASASLSAVMTFYAFIEKKRRVSFMYFLSPSPGYWGWIYLPTFVILPLYFVEDLASYLGTAPEIGTGVAHTAHLGGATFGIVSALILRFLASRSPRWEQILYASYSRSRTEAP